MTCATAQCTCRDIMFNINELREQRAMLHRGLLLYQKQQKLVAQKSGSVNTVTMELQKKLTTQRVLLGEIDTEIAEVQKAYNKIMAAGGSLLDTLVRHGNEDAQKKNEPVFEGVKGDDSHAHTGWVSLKEVELSESNEENVGMTTSTKTKSVTQTQSTTTKTKSVTQTQ